MAQKFELYRCKVCTNMLEITKEGVGELVCCNEKMDLLEEYLPQANDPHYAHIENIDEITKKITFNHPMTKEHYIEFVEAISNDKKYLKRKHFSPDEKCEFILKCDCKEGFYIRLYCNVHGVQKTTM